MTYEKQAENFLKKYGIVCKFENIGTVGHFPNEYGLSGERYQYKVLFKRKIEGKNKQYTLVFTDSIYNYQHNITPTAYDVLACLTKYPVEGNLQDFAAEYGYNIECIEDKKRINKIYQAVKAEYKNVIRFFGDCLTELQEIN